jgi:hypothetical protein
MTDGFGLTRDTQLSFVIELINGSKIKTMGDVEAYFRILNDEQHAASHWALAVRMFANAMSETAYLKAATLTPDGVCDRWAAHPDEFVTLRGGSACRRTSIRSSAISMHGDGWR